MQDLTCRAIAPYQAELANIRYFFKETRTMSQWQDWLRRRMPKLKAVTVTVQPHAPRIGRWGQHQSQDRAVLYTDLLTLLVKRGEIVRTRLPHTTTYVIRPLDKAGAVSYKEELPY